MTATSLLDQLLARVGILDDDLRRFGYEARVGLEDEFYVIGPEARSFLSPDSWSQRRLREAFPEVGRVYAEADTAAIRGTTMRLGIPGLRKWEITTRPIDDHGNAFSAVHLARRLTELRRWVRDEAERCGMVTHWGARPIPDLRRVGALLFPFSISERDVLRSLRSQVESPEFENATRHDFRYWASADAYASLSARFPASPPEARRMCLRSALIASDWSPVQREFGATAARVLRSRVRLAWRARRTHMTATRTALLRATTIRRLCDGSGSVLVPTMAPALGVDINLSLWQVGANAFHETNDPRGASTLFRAVALATTEVFGARTGSLLPAVQSFAPVTFARMFRNDVFAPAFAGFGRKSDGPCCKLSPDSIDANPSRAIEHDHDGFGANTARLEVRVGEPGGALGYVNALASPSYMLAVLIAARRAAMQYSWSGRAPSWPELESSGQRLNACHEDALRCFTQSAILKDGYGADLHALTAAHARRMIGANRAATAA
jgi:hypothetical protein